MTDPKLSKKYEKSLDKMLDRIFARSVELGMTMAALASGAGVCLSTVDRIDSRETRLPRLKTIFLLARAVGMELELSAVINQRRAG